MKLKWHDSKFGPSHCNIGGLNTGVYPAGKNHWRIVIGLTNQPLCIFKGTKDEAKIKSVEMVRTALKKILENIG
jgi:hypothetical protein